MSDIPVIQFVLLYVAKGKVISKYEMFWNCYLPDSCHSNYSNFYSTFHLFVLLICTCLTEKRVTTMLA